MHTLLHIWMLMFAFFQGNSRALLLNSVGSAAGITITDRGISTDASAVASMNFNLNGLPTVNNYLFASFVGFSGSASVCQAGAFTDNQGNTYTRLKEAPWSAVSNQACIYRTKVATSAGTFTLTFAPTGSPSLYGTIRAYELSGVHATTPDDGTAAGADGTSATTITGGSITTSITGSVIMVSCSASNSVSSITPGTGFTNYNVLILGGSGSTISGADGFRTFTGTLTPDMTVSPASAFSCVNVGIRP